MRRATLLCLLLNIGLASTEAEAARRAPKKSAHPTLARKAVSRAGQWVGLSSLKTVSKTANDDCSGLTQLAFQQKDLSLFSERTLPGESGVAAIHRKASALGALRKQPRPGDLVFFRETYDRNRDGKRNDGLTHIGVVEHVGRDGTVTFVHRASDGVKRAKLNLRTPHVRTDARGRVLNDYLRRPDGISEIRLTGQLVAGFAKVDGRWRTPPVKKKPSRLTRSSARR